MCFLKNKEGFEKYLQYLVGQGPAESAVGDRTVHRFFKVTPEQWLQLYECFAVKLSFIYHCALQTSKLGRFDTL